MHQRQCVFGLRILPPAQKQKGFEEERRFINDSNFCHKFLCSKTSDRNPMDKNINAPKIIFSTNVECVRKFRETSSLLLEKWDTYMANRPFLSSASCMRRRSTSSFGYKPNGSNCKFPGKYPFSFSYMVRTAL